MQENKTAEMVPPFRWMGERGYIVGPFKTRMVAEFFVEYVMVGNSPLGSDDCLYEENGNWFIDARYSPKAQLSRPQAPSLEN